MISELFNSIFLTYLASEYLVAQHHDGYSPGRSGTGSASSVSLTSSLKQRLTLLMVMVVLVVNIADRVVGVTEWFHAAISTLHIFAWPFKVLLAAAFYVGALYLDIHKRVLFARRRPSRQTEQDHTKSDNNNNSNNNNSLPTSIRIPFWSIFLPKVGWAFCKVLPAYPFLAVCISVCFMFVINLWEALHLPLEWLNMPIYYGTLYGPFAYTYVHVKQQVMCYETTTLPT
jgi:hypothetical protein